MEGAESPTSTQPNLNELAVDMFEKSAEYIEAELSGLILFFLTSYCFWYILLCFLVF